MSRVIHVEEWLLEKHFAVRSLYGRASGLEAAAEILVEQCKIAFAQGRDDEARKLRELSGRLAEVGARARCQAREEETALPEIPAVDCTCDDDPDA